MADVARKWRADRCDRCGGLDPWKLCSLKCGEMGLSTRISVADRAMAGEFSAGGVVGGHGLVSIGEVGEEMATPL